ncbi:MAG: flagellar hook-length control protein FliK [Spirochaetales bacterium]|nr:flagellar hook-length control protein FliK [Spirochaetales bacterium]MCF7937611.1 flagellar hook-length control protein FliK [Spirochaetales bacterium]
MAEAAIAALTTTRIEETHSGSKTTRPASMQDPGAFERMLQSRKDSSVEDARRYADKNQRIQENSQRSAGGARRTADDTEKAAENTRRNEQARSDELRRSKDAEKQTGKARSEDNEKTESGESAEQSEKSSREDSGETKVKDGAVKSENARESKSAGEFRTDTENTSVEGSSAENGEDKETDAASAAEKSRNEKGPSAEEIAQDKAAAKEEDSEASEKIVQEPASRNDNKSSEESESELDADAAEAGKEQAHIARSLASEAEQQKTREAQTPQVKEAASQSTGRQPAGEEQSGSRRAGSSAERTVVFDLRNAGEAAGNGAEHSGDQSASGGKDNGDDSALVFKFQQSTSGTNAAGDSAKTGSTRQGSFGQMLSRQLEEGGAKDIVRQARIVLKSADSGEMRLVLKPEQLGQVRIQLHLQDNHISGRILVDNPSVREAFEQNISSLQKSFRDEGFETTDLDVSVEDGQTGNGRDRQQKGKNPYYRRLEQIEELASFNWVGNEGRVNLVI